MKTRAQVTRSEAGKAWVAVADNGGCGRCHEAGGCKSGLLNQVTGRPGGRTFAVDNGLGLSAGDWVELEIRDGDLWRSAAWAYGGPLVSLLVGAAGGTLVFRAQLAPDAGALVGAVAGIIGWYCVSRVVGFRAPKILVSRSRGHCQNDP